MRKLIAVIAISMLTACGHTQVAYTPSPRAGMDTKQAASIVEQGFYEDYGSEKAQSAMVTPEYIALSNGTVSRGVNVGQASAYNGVVVGLGSTFMTTQEINQRIYYRSVGAIQVYKKNMRDNRYAVIIRTSEGANARRIFFRSESRAEEFADAMEYLKRSYAAGTLAPQAPAASSGAALSREQQIQQLQQRNLPYEQYQQEYRRIMSN
ncbi:hypothetical protein IB275_13565 [Pseudomonas sp. PDM21]|uniref:hypothetical protein n=1 Tax=Pseudomonas sp. PDM21 TaxID=2769257 RepID=UPI00177B4160|nr:hypothetical protein [Pseudomonas sp. PDM21]MBD9671605.1 hypothetical protein [Pseudomonas sp. PDM21]